MECGIKYNYLGSVGHYSTAALDTHDVSGGVKGSEVYAKSELVKNLGSDKAAFKEVRTAVDNSVTDSLDLGNVLNATDLGVGEGINNDLHCNGVVGHGSYVNDLLITDLVLDKRALRSDSFANTLAAYVAGGSINKLILERRTTCVYYEYVHFLFLLIDKM